LKQSVARQAFDKAQAEGKLLVSAAVVTELNDVLKREKFNKYLREEERFLFLAALLRAATLVEITVTINDCRDPKDNKFLELAVSGHADCIVSGDEDLASLHPFRGIPILTPRAYLEHEWEE
jgi:putative PIN family toxin of toxin-antitoxin system